MRTGTGAPIKLGRELGHGGEGKVYAVENQAGLAAKIYRPEIRQSRQAKITTIVAEKWHKTATEVAFPIDTVWDNKGMFHGFTMRLLGGRRPIHEAYNPSTRRQHFPKATYPFLIRIALNTANAVAKVHATGCVVGDLNHSGFLVAPDATVSLIDADSFQVRSSGQLFPCRVGVPEYTAPELQGVNLSSVLRTANHDAFGLAALIFYILFLGRHPFAGRPVGGGDALEMNEAIKSLAFAYSLQQANRKLAPPPHGPTLKDLPHPLADMFERAFGMEGVSSGRPSAVDWIKALSSFESLLKQCDANRHHHHFRDAPSCPWCRMEKGLPGFFAFQDTPPTIMGTSHVDVGQYIAALQAVPDLGPAPELKTVVAKASVKGPSPAARMVRRKKFKRRSLAALWSLAAISLVLTAWWFALVQLTYAAAVVMASLALAYFLGRHEPAGIADIRLGIAKARSDWEEAVKQWRDATSETDLIKLKATAERSIQELKALPQIEKQKLKELSDNRAEAQRARYLERYALAHASISSLGKARLERLRKSGIETALDLARTNRSKLVKMKGMKAIADDLLAWKDTIERGFIFNPQQGVSPTDMLRVKNELLARRVAVEKRLLQEITAAEQKRLQLIHERAHVRPETQLAWNALRQAELDEKTLRRWIF